MRCSVKIWALFTIIYAVVGCGGKRPPELPPPQSVAPTKAPVLPIDPLLQAYVEKGPFPEYIVGPDDELEIILRDVRLATETINVRPDGNISFSLVENLFVAGMTVSELDSALTRALSNYLRDPKIDVRVSEYRSKVVSLLGAIENISQVGVKTGQGRYSLRNKTRLLDVILQAGGATPDAQLTQVQLIRGSGSYTFNLQRVLNTGDPTHNPILQGNDIIIVPGASRLTKKVVVLGEVRAPDVYLMANDGSLLEALSRAGGLSEVALSDDIRIIRGTEDGPHMFTVNFKRITALADLRQNVVLDNNDIIYVPRSFMGDVNDVLSKLDPLLNVLLLPATYRQLYTTGGGLRLDTGTAPDATAGTQIFTQPLPGTATGAGKVVAPPATEEEEDSKQ
jgi:polysaccharide biosynthesis/export protein